jgi:uncharacterized protein
MPSTPRRPPLRGSSPRPRAGAGARRSAPLTPLGDAEIGELQGLLDAVPSPLDPLDVSMLDGFLCGVLVQPQQIALSRWLRHVTDVDGRPLPARFDASRLHALAQRRHAELAAAIGQRLWFDPWVFELGDEPDAQDRRDTDGDGDAARDAALPWVAGIATAFELFPELTRQPAETTLEPLALLYRHLDPDDLEDADELLAEIETLEPVADLAEAVEGLVRATLLLADAAAELR